MIQLLYLHRKYQNYLILTLFGLLHLSCSDSYTEVGMASYYADKFEGRTTANGEIYNHTKLTAAHKALPLGTVVRVKNLENNKEVIVRVNDRGPYTEGRIIDLSKSAAEQLDFVTNGVARVEIKTVRGAAGTTEP